MTVVKSIQTDDLLRSAVVLDLGDLRRQGERILAQARSEADQILAMARAEAERLKREAAGKGHAEGLARGLQEGHAKGEAAGRERAYAEQREQLAALLERWGAAVEHWEAERGRWMLEAREDVLRFACRFAERVVHRTVKLDPTIVVDQVATTLDLLMQPSRVRITVHPDDRPLVEAALPGLQRRIGEMAHLNLETDQAVERGGCVLGTDRGRVDATIERQIERIVDALLPRGAGAALGENDPDGSTGEAESSQ